MPQNIDPPKRTPLWIMINAVTIRDLQQLLFDKAAKDFKLDWSKVETKDMDARTDQILAAAERLQTASIQCYLDYYSSLRVISIASHAKNIIRFMRKTTGTKPLQTPFFTDQFHMQRTQIERLEHPANMAAWLCVKDIAKDEWKDVVGMAMTEEQKNLSWQPYSIEPPTNIEQGDIERGIEKFKSEFGKAMEKEKMMSFPVDVHRNLSTGKYIRYSIAVPKDPSKTFLVDRNRVIVDFDPTMHTFFIDHFFAEHHIRVSWPVMCDERVVADFFVEHVLGSKIKDEPTLYYTKPLRFYTSSKVSEKMMVVSDSEKEIIHSIFINSLDFTYAETEAEADKRRRMKEDKQYRKANKTELLHPAFRCYNYNGPGIWRYLDEHFSPTRYKAEWRDILSITFIAKLYKVRTINGVVIRDQSATRDFKIICRPDRLRYAPALHEIIEPEYKDALRYIATQKLKLIGEDLAQKIETDRKDEASGSLL